VRILITERILINLQFLVKLNEVEQLANKSYKDRMKGKYLICNYKYDCNGGNEFKVPYISTAYRYSMI
jgi:hypothetical protein